MSDRIKVGDVYFELPKGALGRPMKVVAEKTELPQALDPVAFAPSTPDLLTQYITHSATVEKHESVWPASEPELDQMTALQTFVGVKSTLPKKWLEYADGKRKHGGFNIWAFVFGFYWFVYNKMYGKAAISAIFELFMLLLALGTVGEIIQSPGYQPSGAPLELLAVLFGFVLPRLVIAYWANIALYRKATREIGKIRSFKVDKQRTLSMIASAGAGSLGSVILLNIAFFIIRFVFNNS
jgi:hypothetical protein